MSIGSTVGSSKTEKINQFLMLIKDPDVQPIFRMYIENVLATSDLRILKRLAALETSMGLNDFSDLDDDRQITIPEQLTILAQRMDNIEENTKHESIANEVIIPETLTEHRATQLFEKLQTTAPRNKEIFLSSKQITNFLKHEIQVDYSINDLKNRRQAKADVLKKVGELYSDFIRLDKKNIGNKETRVILKSVS